VRLNLLVTVLWAGLCMLYVVSGPRDWRLAATAATTLIWALVTWLNVRRYRAASPAASSTL